MRATIGPTNAHWFQEPEPRLLASVSRLTPERGELHVLLEPRGIVTAQRLAISGYGGRFVAALWPGELKEQALVLYGNGLGTKVVAAALERGWSAEGTPHLAFRSSPAGQRLYMKPKVDALEYARRWERGDLDEVGAHDQSMVKHDLWPWLKQRGYADDEDDPVLDEWLSKNLKNRPALLRPGLQLKGQYPGDVDSARIRDDVNAILNSAGEPQLG